MSAQVVRLPGASVLPVLQQTPWDREIYRLAELVAERAQELGESCSVEDALGAVRAACAEVFPQ